MIARTLDQFGPTEVTMPHSPAPAMTLQSTEMPSLDPLSIVNEENQLPEPFEITLAATVS